jgi:pentachlorophenol monooxygenase
MLGDVEVDWSVPPGYGVRAMHQTDGKTDDVPVCIPLPGGGRYRMSMLVPDELSCAPAGGISHGFEGDRKPELHPETILVSVSHRRTVAQFHGRHLELVGDGEWRLDRLTTTG